jgi:hypothetical protein
MKEFDLYFCDLTQDAQDRLCEMFQTTPEEENWDKDVFPLAILEREEE